MRPKYRLEGYATFAPSRPAVGSGEALSECLADLRSIRTSLAAMTSLAAAIIFSTTFLALRRSLRT